MNGSLSRSFVALPALLSILAVELNPAGSDYEKRGLENSKGKLRGLGEEIR